MAVAIACDLSVASEDSHWALPNTSLGYYFSWACTPLLVSLVSPGNAKELILGRKELDSGEAVRMNPANMSVPPDRLFLSVKTLSEGCGMVAQWRAHGQEASERRVASLARRLVDDRTGAC